MIRALALALVLVAGCNRGGSVPRIFGALTRSGAADLQCTHVDQVLYVTPRVVQVRGCGRRQEYVVDAARRPMHAIARVETVASHDLVCEVHTLQVESPAPAVRVISGCNRVGRYDLRCDHLSCAWTMTVHSGAWAGSEVPIPSQFVVPWTQPGTAAPISPPEGYVDLLRVDVPPPPAAPASDPVTP